MATSFPEGIIVTGPATFTGPTYLPPGVVSDAQVAGNAATATGKQLHKHRKTYGQSGTVVTATIPIHVVIGTTALLVAIKVGMITLCAGAATVTVDLKKNGTSILAAVITLNSGNTARVCVSGTISNTAAAAGDFFELVVTATAGGGTVGTGLLVELEVDEAPV